MGNVREEWDSTATAYEIFNHSSDSYSYNIEWPCIQEMLPVLEGKSVLDLGCGTGIFTFLLEKYCPAELLGVDLSGGMLTIAKVKAEERNSIAQFMQGDAAKLASYVHKEFDFIFSSTTTHYLPDLHELFFNIGKCLKKSGTCILSVIHPVYSAMYPVAHGNEFPEEAEWTVRYLDKRKRAYIQPWIEYNDDFENQLSSSYHHTISDYINAAISAGLKIDELREPMPPEEWKKDSFGRYDSFIETPTYMVLKISK